MSLAKSLYRIRGDGGESRLERIDSAFGRSPADLLSSVLNASRESTTAAKIAKMYEFIDEGKYAAARDIINELDKQIPGRPRSRPRRIPRPRAVGKERRQMRYIPKPAESEAPEAFKRWKKRHPNAKYSSFHNVRAKSALKESLIRRQKFLCCYCESRITEETSHIEHIEPQMGGLSAHTMDYGNMAASCIKDPKKFEEKSEAAQAGAASCETPTCTAGTRGERAPRRRPTTPSWTIFSATLSAAKSRCRPNFRTNRKSNSRGKLSTTSG